MASHEPGREPDDPNEAHALPGRGRVIVPLRPPDSYGCESCGQTADVRLDDRSTWCLPGDDSANHLGYDQYRGRWLPGRKKAAGGGEAS